MHRSRNRRSRGRLPHRGEVRDDAYAAAMRRILDDPTPAVPPGRVSPEATTAGPEAADPAGPAGLIESTASRPLDTSGAPGDHGGGARAQA